MQTGCPRNSRETSGEDTESALVTILGAARCICPPASFLWERSLPPGHEVRHLTQARSVTVPHFPGPVPSRATWNTSLGLISRDWKRGVVSPVTWGSHSPGHVHEPGCGLGPGGGRRNDPCRPGGRTPQPARGTRVPQFLLQVSEPLTSLL